MRCFALCVAIIFCCPGYALEMPKTQRVWQSIKIEDDLDFENMLLAIQRQEKNFKKKDMSSTVKFGTRNLTRQIIFDSLIEFKQIVIKYIDCIETTDKEVCLNDLNRVIAEKFAFYKPIPLSFEDGYKNGLTKFTAYYSPDFEAKLEPQGEFINPIYGMPKESWLKKSTSDEINFQGKLKGRGLELLYVKKSLYDIWLLHVEGGGRAKIKNNDGTYDYYYLSYAGSNGQKFQMLYRFMLDQGMLASGHAKITDQRRYFLNNPQDQRSIMKSCPSFIYFKITHDEPLGVQNIPLTENRSLATDYRRIKEYGIINYIQFKKPVSVDNGIKQIPFSRFFLNQDTGGAIKGNARCDLYFGYGDDAELAANYVYGQGLQYFLILR